MSIKQLFPSDIINIILQYSGNKVIIRLQDYFTDSLKYVTIDENELKLISRDNYQYIRKLNCHDSDITDEDIKHLTHLTQLDCRYCQNVTTKYYYIALAI